MAIFDSWGVRHPVTVLQLDECEVLQVRRDEMHRVTNLPRQICVGEEEETGRKERKERGGEGSTKESSDGR